MPMLNGSPAPDITFINSATNQLLGAPTVPIVSFSGEEMDLYAANPSLMEGFFFDSPATIGPVPIYNPTSAYGGDNVNGEEYIAENWSLTEKTPVPEPSSLVALGLIGSGLFLNKRRRVG